MERALGREGGRKGGRERGREGEREGRREGGREGGREEWWEVVEVSLVCKNLQFVFFADCNLWIVQVNCGLLQKVQIHALCCTIYGIAQTIH